VDRSPRQPASAFEPNRLLEKLKKPQYALPAAIVVVMLGIAFGLQPGSTSTSARDSFTAVPKTAESELPSPTPSPATPEPTPQPSVTPAATGSAVDGGAAGTPASEVAGARSTPDAAAATLDPALAAQPTQCGALQETAVSLAVEQAISGVSVKATRAAIYPIDYFRCILVATGGNEAYTLASAVGRAENEDMTTILLVDLWVANSSRQFGQINLRTAQVAAAGQSFSPIATLGGRSEVVVSSGQGRNVTLVVAIRNTVGATAGPVTLVIEAPLSGGTPVAGKYQLFLPTP
jgi:hypothetical protein